MMRYLLLLLTFILIIGGAGSCSYRSVPDTHRRFVIPERKTRNHWGYSRRTTLHSRYWGRHRYGPRPHPYRGHFR